MKKLTVFKIRFIQKTLKFFSFFLPIKKQEIFKEKEGLADLSKKLAKKAKKIMVLVGPNIAKRGYQEEVVSCLNKVGIETFLYIAISSEPDVAMVNKAHEFYISNKCDGIFAIGGGSILDLAKAIKSIKKNIMASFGLLKVKKNKMILIASPTTAGTGSEATFAAVIKDKDDIKRTIISPNILPDYVYFDSSYLSSLPLNVALFAGLDAFTHDIESYISNSSSKKTRKYAKESLLLFKSSFAKFIDDRSNKQASLDMLLSSFLAGKSFTLAYVGYAHSIGHALGSKYNLPHGLAVISCLDEVLDFYKGKYPKRKKELEEILGTNDLVKYVSSLKNTYQIKHLELDINKEEAKELASIAYKESVPLYPVPRIATREELASLILKIGGKNED